MEVEFRGCDGSLVLYEDLTNATANGTRLWEAGTLLARYVEANYESKLKKKRVLELGSGTGLLSIYLGKLGATVLSCDNNPLVVALLKKNVAANKVGKLVTVRAFDWSLPADVASVGTEFDFVMGADCVFSLAATEKLVDCLDAVMQNGATLGFMSIETRDNAVTESFVLGMQKKKFDISVVSLRGIDKKYQHEDLAIYRFQRM